MNRAAPSLCARALRSDPQTWRVAPRPLAAVLVSLGLHAAVVAGQVLTDAPVLLSVDDARERPIFVSIVDEPFAPAALPPGPEPETAEPERPPPRPFSRPSPPPSPPSSPAEAKIAPPREPVGDTSAPAVVPALSMARPPRKPQLSERPETRAPAAIVLEHSALPGARDAALPERRRSKSRPAAEPPAVPATASVGAAPGSEMSERGRAGGPIRTTTAPVYLHNPEPPYPRAELRRRREGSLLLRVSVAPDGHVESVEIGTSSGVSAFDRAAIRAVRHWRFRPATIDGIPARGVVEVPIRFSIRR